jgi:alpha,alpha-trehalose phosphorylase
MIDEDAFSVDPWTVTERELRLDLLPQTESLFALSNGHIGVRGNLDEGEPHSMPGTFLNAYYENLPLPYAEAGYGYPEEGQSLINVTNGKIMRLLVDDEPFDVRYGRLARHERTLDLRAGVLRRDVEWSSPTGKAVTIRTTRMVSLAHRAVVAIRYEVTPVDRDARIVLQSTLVANEPLPAKSDDPRAAVALHAPLIPEYHTNHDLEVSLGHRTKASGLRMAVALDHIAEGPTDIAMHSESEGDLGRVTFSTDLQPGQTLTVVKLVAYAWSSQRSMPSLRDQVDAAVAGARRAGWSGLADAQREYLDDVWARADIEIDGDPELQQAVRFAIFQVVQSAARAEKRAIPAKGLTGRGYDGHTFWDMDVYTLPVLTYIVPHTARDVIEWRHTTLPLAQARARELGFAGAAFPWRTIRGQECSGYWPASTAAFHINAGIADAVRRYVAATQDEELAAGAGLELLVQTARLWASLGHYDTVGRFHIDGVTGPDEYSALSDNNTFTNLMAARNLSVAADAASQHQDRARSLAVTDEEIASWREAAGAVVVPYDDDLGVTAQADGFTRYRRWDFDGAPPGNRPMLMRYPYYLLYSSQIVKQADLVFALYLFGERFSDEQKQRDFNYYEPITVRDSSLSACVQGIVAAEVGHLDLAYSYLRESALIDLRDLAGNTADGLHLASLSGAWLAAVAGLGGMRDSGTTLAFRPQLPTALDRLTFRLVYRGRRIRIDLTRREAKYDLLHGDPIKLLHHGEGLTLRPDEPTIVAMPEPPEPKPVWPPTDREPLREGIAAEVNETDAYRHPPWRAERH